MPTLTSGVVLSVDFPLVVGFILRLTGDFFADDFVGIITSYRVAEMVLPCSAKGALTVMRLLVASFIIL